MSAPKPVKEKKVEKDLRLENLTEWKRLFESIDKDIKVTICYEENFRSVLENTLGNIDFGGFYHRTPMMVVILPNDANLNYLIGLSRDEMFSYREVMQDTLLEENDIYPCEPETKKWEGFYYELVGIISDRNTKEVPPAPKT